MRQRTTIAVLTAVTLSLFCLSSFTLAPPRTVLTLQPGESRDITFSVNELKTPVTISAVADDAFNPMPLSWVNVPDRADGDFTISVDVPRQAVGGKYGVLISVAESSGMVRAELRSRVILTVAGEPTTGLTIRSWQGALIAGAFVLIIAGSVFAWRKSKQRARRKGGDAFKR